MESRLTTDRIAFLLISGHVRTFRTGLEVRIGNTPAYEVRRNGVFIHGNRLEMDSDGSTIWVDAGDEFILKGPNVLGSNRIVITEVQEY